jgi:hypothetical protein
MMLYGKMTEEPGSTENVLVAICPALGSWDIVKETNNSKFNINCRKSTLILLFPML